MASKEQIDQLNNELADVKEALKRSREIAKMYKTQVQYINRKLHESKEVLKVTIMNYDVELPISPTKKAKTEVEIILNKIINEKIGARIEFWRNIIEAKQEMINYLMKKNKKKWYNIF